MKRLAALLLTLFSGFALADISLGTSNISSNITSGTDVPVSLTIGSCTNSKLVFALTSRGGGAHTSATVAWNTSESLTRVDYAIFLMEASVWYLDNPTPGSYTVAATMPSSVANGAKAAAWHLCGAAAGAPEDSAIHQNAGITALTTDVTSTEGAWVIAAAAHNNAGSFTNVNGQTASYNVDINGDIYAAGRLEDVSAGTVTSTWDTDASGSGALAIMSIAAAEESESELAPATLQLLSRGFGPHPSQRLGGMLQ